MTMRKYWHLAKMHWQLRMVYRTNALLEALGNLLTMLVSISVWYFIFQYVGQESFGGYSKDQMITYLLLAGTITSTLWYTASGDHVIQSIRTGGFSKYLVKPINFSANHLIAQMIGNLSRFIFSIIVVAVFLSFLGISISSIFQLPNFLIFMAFFLLAMGIQFFIYYCAALLAFWMEEVWGITFVIRVFADVAAGAFVPLSLFAPFWRQFFDLLPFKYIIFVPVNVLLGRFEIYDIFPTLFASVGWLIGLILLTWITWKRGIRHYTAVGN